MQTNTDHNPIDPLEGSDECFRAIFDQAAVGITYMALDGRFLRVNRKFCDIVGYSRDQLLQRTCQEITYPDDLDTGPDTGLDSDSDSDLPCVRRLLTGNSNSYTQDKRYIRPNGDRVWAEVTYSLVLDEAGAPLRFVSVVRDISQRKQAEATLRGSESKYRTLLENLPQKIFLKDRHLAYISCNEGYARDLGIRSEEIVGKTDYDFHSRELADKYRADDRRILASGQTERLEEQYVQDGQRTWVATIKTPVRDSQGVVMGILGTFLDISEQKKANDRIQVYQARLKSLASQLTLAEERTRRTIAADLHDQVGQSLAIMRVQLAVARKQSDGREVAAILDEVSDSLRTAIQDTRGVIADLSSPLLDELGLSAALSEWLKLRIGERYGLEARFSDDGEPKPLSRDTEAILFRSVRELLMNVVKHADATRVSISIERHRRPSGAAVRIVVEDDGVGLADGRRPEVDGSEGGFGLFSIRERMVDLDGSLDIDSRPGRGVRATLIAAQEPDGLSGNGHADD
jgi:PAS domain S-box-containing protein